MMHGRDANLKTGCKNGQFLSGFADGVTRGVTNQSCDHIPPRSPGIFSPVGEVALYGPWGCRRQDENRPPGLDWASPLEDRGC
jgi:hypothetical protein